MLSKIAIFVIILAGIIFGSLFLMSNRTPQRPLTADDYEPDTHTVVDESEEKLVDEFPQLPEYPNANLNNSRRYNEEGGEGFSSEYSTDDSVSEVVEWYKEWVARDGWILIYESENVPDPDFYLIEYKKPDIQLDIHVVELEDKSVKITVTHHYNMGEYGPKVKYE